MSDNPPDPPTTDTSPALPLVVSAVTDLSSSSPTLSTTSSSPPTSSSDLRSAGDFQPSIASNADQGLQQPTGPSVVSVSNISEVSGLNDTSSAVSETGVSTCTTTSSHTLESFTPIPTVVTTSTIDVIPPANTLATRQSSASTSVASSTSEADTSVTGLSILDVNTNPVATASTISSLAKPTQSTKTSPSIVTTSSPIAAALSALLPTPESSAPPTLAMSPSTGSRPRPLVPPSAVADDSSVFSPRSRSETVHIPRAMTTRGTGIRGKALRVVEECLVQIRGGLDHIVQSLEGMEPSEMEFSRQPLFFEQLKNMVEATFSVFTTEKQRDTNEEAVVPWTMEEVHEDLQDFLTKIATSARALMYKEHEEVMATGDNWMSTLHQTVGRPETQINVEMLGKTVWSLFKTRVALLQAKSIQETVDFFPFDDYSLRPIMQICVIPKGKSPPDGFMLLRRNYEDQDASLNAGNRGIYLAYRREEKEDTDNMLSPITGVSVVLGNNANLQIPYGYEKLNDNLNPDSTGQGVFLCVCRGDATPIIELQVVFGGAKEMKLPDGHQIAGSTDGKPANVNSSNRPVYVAFQADLAAALFPFKNYLFRLKIRAREIAREKKNSTDSNNTNNGEQNSRQVLSPTSSVERTEVDDQLGREELAQRLTRVEAERSSRATKEEKKFFAPDKTDTASVLEVTKSNPEELPGKSDNENAYEEMKNLKKVEEMSNTLHEYPVSVAQLPVVPEDLTLTAAVEVLHQATMHTSHPTHTDTNTTSSTSTVTDTGGTETSPTTEPNEESEFSIRRSTTTTTTTCVPEISEDQIPQTTLSPLSGLHFTVEDQPKTASTPPPPPAPPPQPPSPIHHETALATTSTSTTSSTTSLTSSSSTSTVFPPVAGSIEEAYDGVPESLWLEEGMTRTLGILIAGLYAGGSLMLTNSIGCFGRIPPEKISPPLVNLFAQALCGAAPSLESQFASNIGTHAIMATFLSRFVSQFVGVLELSNLMRIVEVCFTLHRNNLPSSVNSIVRTLLCILLAKKRAEESESEAKNNCALDRSKSGEKIDESWNRVRALQGATGPKLRNTVSAFLTLLHENDQDEKIDLAQLQKEEISSSHSSSASSINSSSSESESDYPDTPVSESKLVFPVSPGDEKNSNNSNNKNTSKTFEVDQKKLAGFVQYKQTMKIILNFDRGTVSFARVGEKSGKKYAPQDYDRRTLLAIVKNPANLTELMIHFGPPVVDKRTVMFKNHEDRELFFAAIREGYPHCSTKVHFSESQRREFSDESRFRYVPKRDVAMLRQESTSSTVTEADVEVEASEIADDDDEPLPKLADICTRRDRVLSRLHLERMLNAIVIMCCNVVNWLPHPNRQNNFKNPYFLLSTIKLVIFIVTSVDKCPSSVLYTSVSFIEVLKRYVCPLLITCADHKQDVFFKQGLALFVALWRFRQHLSLQLGLVLEHYQHAVLLGQGVSRPRKLAIWDLLASSIVMSPTQCLDLYHNYDNYPSLWIPRVFQRLVTATTQICLSNRVVERVGARVEGVGAELRIQAAKFLVHLISFISDNNNSTSTNNNNITNADVPRKRWEDAHKAGLDEYNRAKSDSLKSTILVLKREFASVLEKEGMKSGESMDITIGELIGDFIFVHSRDSGLDKAAVGDAISSWDDKVLTNPQHEAVRATYLRHFDFGGMDFDHALRVFLCDGGFRLPGESQKIDRLLDVFCRTFCEQNPGEFRDATRALVVAFAMVMLNTDLHDARLRSGKSSRKPMTLAQFKSNLRGMDDGRNFPSALLEKMYNNIAKKEIKWKDESGRAAAVASTFAIAKAKAMFSRRSHAGLHYILHKQLGGEWLSAPSNDVQLAVFDCLIDPFMRVLQEVGALTIDIDLLEVCIAGAQMCSQQIISLSESLKGDDSNVVRRRHQFHSLQTKVNEWIERLVERRLLIELAWDVYEAQIPQPLIREHRVMMRKYANCVSGNELVNWLIVNNHAPNQEEAEKKANDLIRVSWLKTLTTEGFDANCLYQFRSNPVGGTPHAAQTTRPGTNITKEGVFFVYVCDEVREDKQDEYTEMECTMRLSEGALEFISLDGKFKDILKLTPRVSVSTLSKAPLSFAIGDPANAHNFVCRTTSQEDWNDWVKAIQDAKMAAMVLEDEMALM